MRFIGGLYGVACYIVGVASMVLFILFANNHMDILGLGLDSLNIDTPNGAPVAWPLAVNIALIALFGAQHSIMARPGFKRILTKLVPAPYERSTYILMTALVILVMVHYWQPVPGAVWRLQDSGARQTMTLLYYLGWTISLAATYMLNHFHLMGLQQSLGTDAPGTETREFRTPLFYRFVRHPIQAGIFIALWATPDMTLGHLTLATGMTLYILTGLWFEERDLTREFGDTYRDYKKRVPALLPWRGRAR